jgi:hypothetical protein
MFGTQHDGSLSGSVPGRRLRKLILHQILRAAKQVWYWGCSES